MSAAFLLAMVNKARRMCVFPARLLPLRPDLLRLRQTNISALLFILFVALPILVLAYWMLEPLPPGP